MFRFSRRVGTSVRRAKEVQTYFSKALAARLDIVLLAVLSWLRLLLSGGTLTVLGVLGASKLGS